MSIDNADGAGTIEVFTIGTDSAVGVEGSTLIGNAATTSLTLDGADYRTTGLQTYTTDSGDKILIGADDTAIDFISTDTNISFVGGDLVIKDSADTTIATQAVGATASAGNISFGGAIHGTAGDTTTDLTVNAGTGTVSFQLIDGATTDINDIAVTGSTITLNKNVNTGTSGTVGLTGNVALATGDIEVNTSNGGGGTLTITGNVSGGQNLDLLSGTALTSISGTIGVGSPLTSLDIQQSGTGGVTLSDDIGVTGTAGAGTTRIGTSATTGTITLGGDVYHTGAATYRSDNFSLTATDPLFKTTDLAVAFNVGPSTGTVALADAADLTIQTGAGNITFAGDIVGTDGGVSTGTITTDGTITTAVVSGSDATAGTVTLTGAVDLLGNTTIASNGGAVGVVGTIDSNAAGTKTLTINSGAGNVDVSGKIGATRAVGNTSINASGGTGTIDLFDIGDGTPAAGIDGTLTVGNTLTNQVEFDGVNYDISGNVLIKSKSGDNIDFSDTSGTTLDFRTTGAGSTIEFNTGTLKIADRTAALEITSNNGNITIGAIEGSHDEDITINAGTGTLQVGAIGQSEAQGINTIAMTSTGAGTSKITLTGSITTSDEAGNNVSFTGPVVIDGTVDIDTDATADGTIGFSSTIVGASSGSNNLTLDSGGSAITLSGTIGVATPLTSLNINQDGGTVALTIPQIGTAGGNSGVTGATNIGLKQVQVVLVRHSLRPIQI